MTDKTPNYELDDETLSLIEVALNCLVQLSEAQIEDSAAENLVLIADEIAARFNITRTDLVEEQHGDEIIYKPRGGIFNDEEDEEEDEQS